MKKPEYRDFPFAEVCDAAQALVDQGMNVHQKFTCDGCGSRQTIATPNKFFTQGLCEECGHVTDIVRRGCNYLLMTGV